MKNEELSSYIVIDQSVCFGKRCITLHCIKGTRIIVGDILYMVIRRNFCFGNIR
jgi:uncharacterized protein (DUF433 family)